MLTSKLLVDSILPENLKQLESYDYENLKVISESLEGNLEQLRSELNALKPDKIGKIEPDIKKSENFIARINQLHVQIDAVKQDLNEQESLIKNVSQIEEYKNLIDHIEILNQTINVIQFLHEFETDITSFKSAINERNLTKCHELLNKLDKKLRESAIFKRAGVERSLDEILESDTGVFILKELKDDLKVEREHLWLELDLEWDQLIQVNVNETDPVKSCVRISRSIDQTRLDRLTCFSALKLSQPTVINNRQISFVFVNRLKQFCAKFLNLCTSTVINNTGLYEIRLDEEADFKSIRFSEKPENDLKAIDRLEIKLNQLEILFKFIYDNMFCLKVTLVEWPRERNGTMTTSSQKLISLFADLTLKEFTRLVYEQLVLNIIPVGETGTGFDCSMEAEICTRIGRFERQLAAIECTLSERAAASDGGRSFSSSVEELYVRKKCKHVTETAREMMKKRELMFELVDTKGLCAEQSGDVIERLREIEICNRGKQTTSLDELNLLNMPPCSISIIAKQVTDLVESTLQEAYDLMSESGAENLKNVSLLCLAARNIFDLYTNIIPVYHSANLKSVPQLAAIVHNDMLFLAHTCLTLYSRYKTLLASLKAVNSAELKIEYFDLNDLINNFSFVDMVPKLCTVGFRILNDQVHKQQANLIDYLNENPGSIRNINEPVQFELVKKSIQKCIFQISNLSNVWLGVLNRIVYFKLIGVLFDLVCQDLLKQCLKLEDIESENSNYLHTAFSGLYQAIIDVFSRGGGDRDVDENGPGMADLNAAKYVVSWNRFKYILRILKANLIEIDDMWSEGKGPVALYYEPEEVRGLIRALFMNTDRRAAVLAKIK